MTKDGTYQVDFDARGCVRHGCDQMACEKSGWSYVCSMHWMFLELALNHVLRLVDGAAHCDELRARLAKRKIRKQG